MSTLKEKAIADQKRLAAMMGAMTTLPVITTQMLTAGLHHVVVRQIAELRDDQSIDHASANADGIAPIVDKKDFDRAWSDRSSRFAVVFSNEDGEFTNYFNLFGYVKADEVGTKPEILNDPLIRKWFKMRHNFDLTKNADDLEIGNSENGFEDYALYKGVRILDPEKCKKALAMFSEFTKACDVPHDVSIPKAVEAIASFADQIDIILSENDMNSKMLANAKGDRTTTIELKKVGLLDSLKLKVEVEETAKKSGNIFSDVE